MHDISDEVVWKQQDIDKLNKENEKLQVEIEK